jgi:tetratricopeptide (TPR) repeat protein
MEGDLSQALDAIRAGLALYPQHAKLLFAEAQLLAALGDTATAEACLRGHLVTGVEHEPFECADRTIAEFRVRHLLAELLLHVGRYEEAEHQAIGVTQDRPAYGAAHLTLAESLLAQGKSVEFDAVFRRFDTTADGEVARNVMHAARCRINGQPDQAVAILDKVLVAHPEHLVAMRARVLALFENGIRSGAIVPAIDSVLRLDAMCMCTWAIKRACAAYHSATVLWSQNLRPTAHAS